MSIQFYRELSIIEHCRMRRVKLWACFVGLCLGLLCHAKAVTLAWDASPDPDVAGYILYYGTNGSGSYQFSTNCGNVTTQSVAGLLPNLTYWFVVTAYNTSGLQSDPSNEISYTVDTVLPTIAVTYPPASARPPPGPNIILGTAHDDRGVAQVLYKVGTNAFVPAMGTTNWTIAVTLPPGTNTVTVESVDGAGNTSVPSVVTIICVQGVPYNLRLTR